MAVKNISDISNDPSGTFEALWEEHGIPPAVNVRGTAKKLTPVYNRGAFLKRLEADREELDAKGLEDAAVYRGMARRAFMAAATADADDRVSREALEEMEARNVIDSNVAERSTPLVFDPEVLEKLKDAAPISFGRWNRRGQEGYEAVFNRIDQREPPIGRVPEAVARRLQDLARDFGLNRETEPMRIYVDTAEVGGFASAASAHYMDLEDLTVMARMAEYAQFDEQEMFYGRYELDGLDTSPTGGSDGEFDYEAGGGTVDALEGGSPVGAYAARGLAEWFRLADEAASTVDELPDTDHYIDKSAVSEDIAEDIKAEVTDLLQGPYATSITDLEIWGSFTMEDFLENEFVPRARHDTNGLEIRFGGENLWIKQVVPFVATHNVDEHTYVAQDEDDDWREYDEADADYEDRTVGSEGDVFIVNTAVWEKRELAPLSSFPLAVRGDSDEIGMVAYDANVELSGGFFGKYLSGYDI